MGTETWTPGRIAALTSRANLILQSNIPGDSEQRSCLKQVLDFLFHSLGPSSFMSHVVLQSDPQKNSEPFKTIFQKTMK